jgi:hypothetical protein
MWDMQIVRIFTVRVLVLGSRAGEKNIGYVVYEEEANKRKDNV